MLKASENVWHYSMDDVIGAHHGQGEARVVFENNDEQSSMEGILRLA
jgi:hypothetical protein